MVDHICELADEVLVCLQALEAQQVLWARFETAFLLGCSLEEVIAMEQANSKEEEEEGSRDP